MKVNIFEIEKVISILLEKLRRTKGNEIELKNDFYWDIASDDLEELKRLNNTDGEISYDLKIISSILTALSIENPTAF